MLNIRQRARRSRSATSWSGMMTTVLLPCRSLCCRLTTNTEGNLTFSIVGTSTDKLTVFAASAEEKKHWIDEINNNLVNLPNVQLLKSLQNSDSVGTLLLFLVLSVPLTLILFRKVQQTSVTSVRRDMCVQLSYCNSV